MNTFLVLAVVMVSHTSNSSNCMFSTYTVYVSYMGEGVSPWSFGRDQSLLCSPGGVWVWSLSMKSVSPPPSRSLTCSRFLRGQRCIFCVKSPTEQEDDNDGAASLGSSRWPMAIMLGSWRNPPNHGACGPLSFLPRLWNVPQLTPGILPTLLQNWIRQR